MSRIALLISLLVLVSCKSNETKRYGKVVVVYESLNAWYDWGHRDFQVHVECAGLFSKRLATNLSFHSGSGEYVAVAEQSAPQTLLLVDTRDCSVTKLITDARMNVIPVEWNQAGTYGLFQLTGHVGGGNSGTIDITKGASASFIIRATRPPTMEPLDGQSWMNVGSNLYGAPAWSPSGEVLLLGRHLSALGGAGYALAVWSPTRGLQPLEFKSAEDANWPEHGWSGNTPYIVTPGGNVMLSLPK